MDLRFVAVMMAVVIIMDMLGRMARKRAADQQSPPGEEWDMLEALAEGREPPGAVATEALPAGRDQVGIGVEPHSVGRADEEPPFRDRSPRPVVVGSRETRPVEQRWELPEREPLPEPPQDPPYRPVAVQPAAVQTPAGHTTTVRPPTGRRPVVRALQPGGSRTRRSRPVQPDDRLDLGTIGGLRRALIAREVLGPPVAMRGEEPEWRLEKPSIRN